MDGMDNVQISNQLWIEKDQQKCLGQFSYPNLDFWLTERVSQKSDGKLDADSQKVDHFNILTVKNNTILDSGDYKCLDKISPGKY